MKEQLDLVLPGPSFLARRWRNLLVHGRVLNLGYLAILVACLWKILAAMAVATVFTHAALALIPELGISQSEAAQWYAEWSKTGKASPAFHQRVTEIVDKRDILFANFEHVLTSAFEVGGTLCPSATGAAPERCRSQRRRANTRVDAVWGCEICAQ
jgi:hypothetical protein